MRTASLTALTLLACGLAFAGRAENAVYTGGNLDGIAPQANVVVDLSGDKAIKIRSGRTDFSVPYAGVTKTDVSATDVAAPPTTDATRPQGKGSSSKSAKPAQMLTVEFKNAHGEAKTMTLQLTQPAAASVIAAVRKHSPVAQTAGKEKSAKSDKAKSNQAKSNQAKSNQAIIDNTAVAQVDATQKDATPKDKPKKIAKKSKKDQSGDDKAAQTQDVGKKEVAKNDPASKATQDKDGSWWGDSVWKTPRNQAKWEQQSAAAAQ